MKRLFKIFASIVVITLVSFAAMSFFTRPLVHATEQFLAALDARKFEDAYKQGAQRFQQALSQENLGVFADRARLNHLGEINWWSRSVSGDSGTLVGTVTRQNGEVIPLTVSLVYEAGTWKLLSIEAKVAGVFINGEKVPPPDAIVEKMVGETFKLIKAGVDRADYAELYHSFYSAFRQNVTITDFTNDISVFKKIPESLKSAIALSPVFIQSPHFDDLGLLNVVGRYPSSPLNIHFNLKYIYSDGLWQLAAYQFDATEPGKLPVRDNQRRDPDAAK